MESLELNIDTHEILDSAGKLKRTMGASGLSTSAVAKIAVALVQEI
ncbi:MAG: hypothetical protein ACI9KN_001204 [Gammaproteobacteria bacterium]|jgi:hypothetical protein